MMLICADIQNFLVFFYKSTYGILIEFMLLHTKNSMDGGTLFLHNTTDISTLRTGDSGDEIWCQLRWQIP